MPADFCPFAVWDEVPKKYGYPGGTHGQNKPRYVIIHGTAGGSSAAGLGAYYRTTDRATSAHFGIGTDGAIHQFVRLGDAAWGNGNVTAGHAPWWTGNPNLYTVSVEHCKPRSDNGDILTPAQTAASYKLVKWLCEEWKVPAILAKNATGGIAPHSSIDPVNRARCPGPYPWDGLLAYIGGGSMVPAGWTDDGTTLKAPNGYIVVRGFRTFVLNIPGGWDAKNQPLENEHKHPDGQTSRQIFTYNGLRYVYATEAIGFDDIGAQLLAKPTEPPPSTEIPEAYQLAYDAVKALTEAQGAQ